MTGKSSDLRIRGMLSGPLPPSSSTLLCVLGFITYFTHVSRWYLRGFSASLPLFSGGGWPQIPETDRGSVGTPEVFLSPRYSACSAANSTFSADAEFFHSSVQSSHTCRRIPRFVPLRSQAELRLLVPSLCSPFFFPLPLHSPAGLKPSPSL